MVHQPERPRIAAPGPTVTVLLAALLTVLAGALPAGPAHSAQVAALPLGKQRFAVAVGGLSPASTANWVRLGLYTFSGDGTVDERHWHWTQRRRATRSSTGIQADGCPSRNCAVQTAGGYQSTGASKTLTGTYAVDGDRLQVTWSGGLREEWTLSSRSGGALASLEFAGSNFGVTHGFGYGSNAAWDARASAAEIAALDHAGFDHRFHLWKTTSDRDDPFIDSGSGNPFWVRDWSVCGSGRCLGAVTGGGSTQYYVSPARTPTGHRRDTLWHWRTALADGRGEYCYEGNSHVKPMVQIIDDNGDFHGWVGVEASLNQTTDQGALADDLGVFVIAG